MKYLQLLTIFILSLVGCLAQPETNAILEYVTPTMLPQRGLASVSYIGEDGQIFVSVLPSPTPYPADYTPPPTSTYTAGKLARLATPTYSPILRWRGKHEMTIERGISSETRVCLATEEICYTMLVFTKLSKPEIHNFITANGFHSIYVRHDTRVVPASRNFLPILEEMEAAGNLLMAHPLPPEVKLRSELTEALPTFNLDEKILIIIELPTNFKQSQREQLLQWVTIDHERSIFFNRDLFGSTKAKHIMEIARLPFVYKIREQTFERPAVEPPFHTPTPTN